MPWVVLTFEPKPTSTARIGVRAPYLAPQMYEQPLADLASGGWLVSVSEDDVEGPEESGRTVPDSSGELGGVEKNGAGEGSG
jgi:hypothetical protein